MKIDVALTDKLSANTDKKRNKQKLNIIYY